MRRITVREFEEQTAALAQISRQLLYYKLRGDEMFKNVGEQNQVEFTRLARIVLEGSVEYLFPIRSEQPAGVLRAIEARLDPGHFPSPPVETLQQASVTASHLQNPAGRRQLQAFHDPVELVPGPQPAEIQLEMA